MNRQQRRLQAQKISRKKLIQTARQQIHEDVAQVVENHKTEMLMACFCLALHREFGFGKVRCLRALNAIDEIVLPVIKGDVTKEMLRDQCVAECDVLIKCD